MWHRPHPMRKRGAHRRAFAASVLPLLLVAVVAQARSAAADRAPEALASAAGTQIVHVSTRRDAGIFTMDPRGRGRHRLRRGLVDGVAVSANGRRIAFARSRPTPCARCPADFFAEVLVADGRARHARLIKKFRHASAESLAISPNGRWIAVSLFRGAGADLYLMRSDGSRLRRLTRGERAETSPTFSPDGRRIAFSREGRGGSDIFTIRRRGGGLRRLTRGRGSNSDPAYSPNGRRIAYSHNAPRGDAAIFVMRSDGSRPRRVTSARRGLQDVSPDFSPGGRAIAFARGLGVRFDIYTVRANGRNLRRAAHAGIGLIEPDWTRRP